jgi:serine O-acetyltransferase
MNPVSDESYNFSPDIKETETTTHVLEATDTVVKRLLESCVSVKCFDHIDSNPIPSLDSVAKIIQQARNIIFPGYFSQYTLASSTLEYCLRQEAEELLKNISKLIILTVQHDCLRYDQACTECSELGRKKALLFIQSLPGLRSLLATDVRAGYKGDPAATSYDEVIFSYPGLFAITVYRLAHVMYLLRVPLLPRMMTEYAHSLTGIDIHPGARIGESFFIDHGTGVVVGETTYIGKRVRIYQGVTLGALSIPSDSVDLCRNKKRHPTIEDDVIVYSNATILGGETVIGRGSTIGGNVWIIDERLPPNTKVVLKKPELIYSAGYNSKQSSRPPKEKPTVHFPAETKVTG